MKAKIFALYRGDTNICDGTINQIAKYMNISPKTVSHYRTPAYERKAAKAKNPRSRLILVQIDE